MTATVGEAAPDFTLPTDGGGSVSLSGLKGQKVIVYFYPKDDTPGLHQGGLRLSRCLPDFSRKVDATIIGVSKDTRRQAR